MNTPSIDRAKAEWLKNANPLDAQQTRDKVCDLIQAHNYAVVLDEASFNDDGTSKDELKSAVTLAGEIGSFRLFIKAPCQTDADVQAKVNYILNGTVGDRDRLIDLLGTEEYCQGDDLLGEFLQSLVLPSASEQRDDGIGWTSVSPLAMEQHDEIASRSAHAHTRDGA